MNSFNQIICCIFCFFSFSLSAQIIDSVNSDGHTIYFEIQGQGDPLYVLAGGPAVHPQYLNGVLPTLAEKNQVVVIHQRGTGLTQGAFDDASISIDQYCRDIHAVKEKLGHTSFSLLGHSWGGMLAMHFATVYPGDLHKLLLVSSGGCNLEFFNYFGDNIDAMLSEELQDSIQYFNSVLTKNQSIAGDSAMQESLAALFSLLRVRSAGYYYDKGLASKKYLTPDTYNIPVSQFMMGKLFRAGWDLRDKLKMINVPTMILIGRQDPIGMETAYVIRDAIRASTLHVIEKCGHFPWIEQPDKFYAMATEFLNRPYERK